MSEKQERTLNRGWSCRSGLYMKDSGRDTSQVAEPEDQIVVHLSLKPLQDDHTFFPKRRNLSTDRWIRRLGERARGPKRGTSGDLGKRSPSKKRVENGAGLFNRRTVVRREKRSVSDITETDVSGK